jgi:hypothetical protein
MRRLFACLGLALALGGLAAPPAAAQPDEVTLRVVGWNMQSDFTSNKKESSPDFLAKQIAKKSGVHLWGLCEVLDQKALDKFVAGAGKNGGDFDGVLGTTGNRDKLAVIYDKDRLTLLGTDELKLIQLSSAPRWSPSSRANGPGSSSCSWSTTWPAATRTSGSSSASCSASGPRGRRCR